MKIKKPVEQKKITFERNKESMEEYWIKPLKQSPVDSYKTANVCGFEPCKSPCKVGPCKSPCEVGPCKGFASYSARKTNRRKV